MHWHNYGFLSKYLNLKRKSTTVQKVPSMSLIFPPHSGTVTYFTCKNQQRLQNLAVTQEQWMFKRFRHFSFRSQLAFIMRHKCPYLFLGHHVHLTLYLWLQPQYLFYLEQQSMGNKRLQPYICYLRFHNVCRISYDAAITTCTISVLKIGISRRTSSIRTDDSISTFCVTPLSKKLNMLNASGNTRQQETAITETSSSVRAQYGHLKHNW